MKSVVKSEIRVIGIDDAPFNKFKDNYTLVVGTIFRGGLFMDGVLSTRVRVDGNNSTKKIAEMINNSKFKPQLQCVLLDGIAVAGFNIIDVKTLNKMTGLPVIVVMRTYPDFDKIKAALEKLGKSQKIKLLEKAGRVYSVNEIYIQIVGIELEKAKRILKVTCTRSFVPEPIRVAHLIASGVVDGQSRGRA